MLAQNELIAVANKGFSMPPKILCSTLSPQLIISSQLYTKTQPSHNNKSSSALTRTSQIMLYYVLQSCGKIPVERTHIFYSLLFEKSKCIAPVKLITLFFMWKYYHFQHDQMYYFEYVYDIAIQKPKTPLIHTHMQIADVMKCIFASNQAKSNKINYLEPKIPTICTNCV